MTPTINTPDDDTTLSENTLVILRDSRTLFQRRLREIARLAGVISPPVADAFTEALGAAYDKLAASSQREGFEQTHGLTASHITLMGDDDLDLGIRLGEIARRLGDIGGNALWRAQLRYMTLLQRSEMAQEANPVGPEVICQGLWAICRSSNAGLDGNLTLLERIEELLALQLPGLYNELNELLAGRDIEPAQTQITSTGGTRSPPHALSSSNPETKANPLSVLQGMLNQQRGSAGGAFGFVPDSYEGETSSANSALGTAALVMLNQLAARLDQLELSGSGSALLASAQESETSEQPALPQSPRTIKAKDLDLPLGKPEAIALDTLGHIFEAIFNTWELPDTIKTAIGRLQIPILKLALFDTSLFSDTEHPARRLINGMARAAVGLPRDVSRAHPLSTHLWRLASTVSETLQRDASVLTAPLAELDAIIVERDSRVLATAQPYIALLRDKEAHEQVSLAVGGWLQSIEQQNTEPEILDFLRQYWVHVMEAAHIEDSKGSQDGRLWQESHAAISDLLWSVQPKQSPEDRKRLVGLVPTLLKRIGAGLDRIGTPAGARAPFLDTCFNLQTAALRGQPSVLPQPPAPLAPADAALPPSIVIDIFEADGKQLKTLILSGTAPATSPSPESYVPIESWLQFFMTDSVPLCGLVCWLNPHSGSTLLFNPDWGYAVALTPAVLEQQLRDAQAKVVSSQAIFDIAAERVMKQLAEA